MKIEEKQAVEVEIFNEVHVLARQDFIDFNQLVSRQHFTQIKNPFQSIDDQKIRVLNILLYYIVSVQKNFKPINDDAFGDKYRALCTKEISDYYIKNKFIIEEYEFAYLSSKVLGLKLEESAHIIYFLVYGRFASHPYINTLCGRKDYDYKAKVFKKGKEVIENFKLLKKRTVNTEKQQTDHELQNFKKELKGALNSEQTHVIWKKDPLKNTKPAKISQHEGSQHRNATERKTANRSSGFNSFVPQRISQGENSSIFQSLPFHKKSYQTCTNWNKKGLMRKQKFNQFFDINDYKIKTKLKKSPSSYFQDSKQNHPRNAFFSNSNSEQSGKINYQNFKKISNNLKAKNTALDKIRAECSIRNQRPSHEKQNTENPVENSIKSSQPNKPTQFEAKFLQFSLESSDPNLQTLNLRRNFSSIDGNFLQQLSLNKNFFYAPQRNTSFAIAQEENEKGGEFTINLLRNDELGKEKENEEGKKIDYFSRSSVGFKKMNCKYKLQRYKSDYRKFMKTQLLDRIKQAV